MVDETLEAGVDVTLDTYPYLPGCTTLAALLPSWASAGGPSKTLERLEDPEIREKIRVAVEETGCDGGHGIPTNWEEIQITSTQDESILTYAGKRVAEVARIVGKPPIEVFFEVLRKDKLATGCLMHIGNEENVRMIMKHAKHMAGSDAILHGQTLHPRAYGTFTKYLAHYARELEMFTIPEIIAHLTSRPAKRLNVYPFRGHLAEGSAADLVLFHPDAVQDMATFDEPKLPSRGIRFVLVNGEVAVDEGKLTGARGGKVLRRAKDGSITSNGASA
ncbi:hypothetical protein K4F52_007079 [Lecanicillium sp. MT-2017a]|nr:hypothetical protein K4F52_007079 [Lecanicillium sp. MT-2017a]